MCVCLCVCWGAAREGIGPLYLPVMACGRNRGM